MEKAHGYYEHWLWPMHSKENAEAGCQQCHSSEIVTEMADTLNSGREIFRLRGCMGCHRYEGFDRDADELSAANSRSARSEQQKAEWLREAGFSHAEGRQDAKTTARPRSLYAHANDLKVRSTRSRSPRWNSSTCARKELIREIKKVGPSLKEVRDEDAQGVDPGLAAGPAQVAARHQDADLPAGSG